MMVGMEVGKVYRLTIDLTTRHVSEPEQFVFSLRDIDAAFDHDHDFEPLFPNDPETYWHRWQGDPDPLPGTLFQTLDLPG
jgi:hypothetical protein